MSNEKPFKFTADQFYELLNNQGGKCDMTGRELTPVSCEVELREPNKEDGRFKMDNFYLVCRELRFLCRNLSETEVVDLCADVLRHRGQEYGYVLKKRGK